MSIKWIDKWGGKHEMSQNAATATLTKFYDEWPGGLEEIESTRENLRHQLAAATKTLEGLGYTYHGGEVWQPPLGPAPFKHKMSGRLYQLIGPAHIQGEKSLDPMDAVQVYRDINTTGGLWVREAGEFNERFEQL